MGHHGVGCGVLDGDEDKAQVAEGPGLDGLLDVLLNRSGASGREGPEGPGDFDRGSLEGVLEQVYHAISVLFHQAVKAQSREIPTQGHSYTATARIILSGAGERVAVF